MNWDFYFNNYFLTSVPPRTTYFTKNVFIFVEPNIEKINHNDVAIIEVKKSSSPVFVTYSGKKMFFIRGSASVQKFDLEETAGYTKAHWE